MSTNGLRKFNHHPSGMKESFLGDYYYDTEVDAFIRTQQATIDRLTHIIESVKPYLAAAADGSMSRNNSEQLAAELIAEIEAEG